MGARLQVFDPEAMPNVRRMYGDRIVYCQHRDDVLAGADALAILTEWKQFVHPDFDEVRTRMRGAVIFDGRNLYNPRADAAGRLHLLQHRPADGEAVSEVPSPSGRGLG